MKTFDKEQYEELLRKECLNYKKYEQIQFSLCQDSSCVMLNLFRKVIILNNVKITYVAQNYGIDRENCFVQYSINTLNN